MISDALENLRRALAEKACAGAVFPTTGRPLWVYGGGTFGRDVADAIQAVGYEVAGFIEQDAQRVEAWGRPVRALGDVAFKGAIAQIAVAVFNRSHPLGPIVAKVRASGIDDVFMPWDYYGILREHLGWRYWLEDSGFPYRHFDDLARVYEKLADAQSRDCLRNLVAFRTGLNYSYSGHTDPVRQYFNELTLPKLSAGAGYVDGGAYDGDTFFQLRSLHAVGRAWLFEPDPWNFRALCAKASGSEAIHCLPLGLSDNQAFVRFQADGGEGSRVDDAGDSGITTVALDDVIGSEPIDLIKLDVEGAERAALTGARRTIERCAPTLTVSAYHRPNDFWDLMDLLHEFDSNYRFYLRQHYFNTFDLVLYASRRG